MPFIRIASLFDLSVDGTWVLNLMSPCFMLLFCMDARNRSDFYFSRVNFGPLFYANLRGSLGQTCVRLLRSRYELTIRPSVIRAPHASSFPDLPTSLSTKTNFPLIILTRCRYTRRKSSFMQSNNSISFRGLLSLECLADLRCVVYSLKCTQITRSQ